MTSECKSNYHKYLSIYLIELRILRISGKWDKTLVHIPIIQCVGANSKNLSCGSYYSTVLEFAFVKQSLQFHRQFALEVPTEEVNAG